MKLVVAMVDRRDKAACLLLLLIPEPSSSINDVTGNALLMCDHAKSQLALFTSRSLRGFPSSMFLFSPMQSSRQCPADARMSGSQPERVVAANFNSWRPPVL
jgi:hypothetical protein